MIAPGCSCDQPRVFAPDEECHRCGRFAAPKKISASTWRLAIALAEFSIGNGRGLRTPNCDPPDF